MTCQHIYEKHIPKKKVLESSPEGLCWLFLDPVAVSKVLVITGHEIKRQHAFMKLPGDNN